MIAVSLGEIELNDTLHTPLQLKVLWKEPSSSISKISSILGILGILNNGQDACIRRNTQ